jgi:hypothetical protein
VLHIHGNHKLCITIKVTSSQNLFNVKTAVF